MGREFELKFRAAPSQLAALQAHFRPERRIAMETTYFDTPDGLLSRKKWTLRRRLENGVSVCTLKTPASGGGRGEWEAENENIRLAISELCKLDCPGELASLSSGELVPVCAARFTRLAADVILPDCTLEVALDQGCLLGGGREIPLCEAEFELKSGSEEAAVAFAREMAETFGLTPEPASKFRRAMLLARESDKEKNNGI